VLGTLPWIASLEPASVQAGGPAFELVVTGERFLDGAQVRWNGVALPTEFGSSTVMTATVDAAKIGAAGEAAVTVRNPGGDLDSNTLPFVIHNPVPEITSLSPNSTSAGGPAFTLTVNGADFVDGAEVLWDGESLATSYVSSTQLEAQVEAARITIARAAGIAVRNPTPSGGVSQAVTFRIEGTGVGPLYLPLVIRDGAP
jgi:hypothetical protein